MKRMDGKSYDNVQARIDAMQQLFPEAVTEGKLDYSMLMALLGEAFDDDQEKYQFTWKGKQQSLMLAQRRSGATLRPDFADSRDWDTTGNLYLEGDNLEVLKLLQQGYLRKVKMIYIDPPYNTGNDFVYEDDFSDPIAKYKEATGQGMRANPETAGRYHSNWLNMMYPRLKIVKTLLRDDGVIFISIDDGEVHNLRKLCDEVFGEENFVATVIWEKKYAPANDAKWLSDNHDYVLVYARRKDQWRPQLLPRSEEQNSRYTNRDNDPRGVWKAADMTVKTYSASYDYPITTPSGRTVTPAQGRCWNTSKENFNKMVEDNRIWFGENGDNVPAVKKFLTEVKDGMVPMTLWKYEDVGHNQEGRQEVKKLFDDNGLFDGPKPVRLLSKMLRIANIGADDIILDFFSGSATTAHAVMQLNAEDGGNRKYIMVQIPEPTAPDSEAFKAGYPSIADIGKERIRRAGDKILAAWQEAHSQTSVEEAEPTPPDIGFRVFKLDSSNFKKWDDTPVTEDQLDLFVQRMEDSIDSRKPDRRDIDVVYEVFLKYGIPLTEALTTLDIQGKTFYVVGENGYLFICLDSDLAVEVVEEAIRYTPGTILFDDACFADDDALTNAALVLEKAEIEFRWI